MVISPLSAGLLQNWLYWEFLPKQDNSLIFFSCWEHLLRKKVIQVQKFNFCWKRSTQKLLKNRSLHSVSCLCARFKSHRHLSRFFFKNPNAHGLVIFWLTMIIFISNKLCLCKIKFQTKNSVFLLENWWMSSCPLTQLNVRQRQGLGGTGKF